MFKRIYFGKWISIFKLNSLHSA